MQISQLNRYPLRKFRELFGLLAIPDLASLGGRYQGTFVGSAWARTLVKPALVITGLSDWWGKDIHEDGTAINILLRNGKFSTRFPMEFVREKSRIDGRDGIALHYRKDHPVLWLFIVDEIRRIDEATLLGMTRPTVPGLRWFALPFALEKRS